jgi:hypothetical protein
VEVNGSDKLYSLLRQSYNYGRKKTYSKEAWLYPETLNKDGKACQGQTLKLITKISE